MYSSGGQIFHLLLGFKPNHYCTCIFKQIFPLYYFIYKRMSYNKIQIVYELVVDLESLSNNWIVIFHITHMTLLRRDYHLPPMINVPGSFILLFLFVCLSDGGIWYSALQAKRTEFVSFTSYIIILYYILYSIPICSHENRITVILKI